MLLRRRNKNQRKDLFMSKTFTKEDVILNKKEAIKSINKLLESYINDTTQNHLKKANLISYWLKDFAQYIRFEKNLIQ